MASGHDQTERLAELIGAAAYGTVLVLGALSVVGVSEVALGHGAELVVGVGAATWLAHLFAEVLAHHVRDPASQGRPAIRRAAADGSPILLATVLPALTLLTGRVDLLDDRVARLVAIGVGTVQLFAIGVLVASVTPTTTSARWRFGGATALVGLAVVLVTVFLGH